jgi:multisubunit Na+/H+ antiporter MnhG subunit
MQLVNLIAGAMVVMGAALMLIGGIGLVLTRSEERESETEVARATRTSSDRLRRPPSP